MLNLLRSLLLAGLAFFRTRRQLAIEILALRRTATDGHLDFAPREVWRGYISDPSWPLLEDDDGILLYVRSRDETTISGAVVFGTGEAPEPATDPLIGYLPAPSAGMACVSARMAVAPLRPNKAGSSSIFDWRRTKRSSTEPSMPTGTRGTCS